MTSPSTLMMSPKLAVFAWMSLLPSIGLAQQSLFESQNGDTSIFLNGTAGVISANIGKSDVRFGYLHQFASRNGWGFDLAGTLRGDTATLLRNNPPAPGAEIRTAYIRRNLVSNPPNASNLNKNSGPIEPCPRGLCDDWLVIQAGYKRTRFYTIDTGLQPLPEPTRRNFDGWITRVAYNQLRKTARNDFLLGVSAGLSRANNTDELDTVQVTDEIVSTVNGIDRRAASDAVTAYTGAYRPYIGVPISADAIWFPGALTGRVGIDLFLRSNVGQANRYGSPGIGLFFSKAGQPARPVGGLSVAYKDGKAQAALIVGWSF